MATTAAEVVTEYRVARGDLAPALAAAAAVTQKKTSIPVLSHVLLRADGNGLEVSATDLDVSLRQRVPAAVAGRLGIAVPARKLSDVAKLLGGADVRLVVDVDGLSVRCGSNRSRLRGMDADVFPSIPEPDASAAWTDVSAADLEWAIDCTHSAQSATESRFTLSGALLELRPDGSALVATDGHRLHVAALPELRWPRLEEPRLIPRSGLAAVRVLLGDGAGEVEASVSSRSHAFFRRAGQVLSVRYLEGSFPNWRSIMPEGGADLVVDVEALRAAVRRAAIVCGLDGALRLTASREGVEIKTRHSESGEEFSEWLPDEVRRQGSKEATRGWVWDAEPTTVGLAAGYLVDALELPETDSVVVNVAGDHRGVLLTSAAEPGTRRFSALIMPRST